MRKRKKSKPENSLAKLASRAKEYFPKQRHELNTDVLLVVDGMNIAYQAFHAYSKLSYMGKSTAILFGMPTIIGTILKTYPAKKVIVCWDGEKHPKRMKLLPEYKMHREKDRDPKQRKKFINQIKAVRKLLNRMGIAQAYNPSMEGDDMIYWIWKKYIPFYKIVIATGDKDMHQLIDYDTTVYNPRTKIPYSNFAYICDHLVEPYQYVDYLCLVGDSSDDIPGYRGIGKAKGAGFFKAFKGIKDYLSSEKEFSGLVDKEKLKEIWKRNRLMLDLRRFNEKYHTSKDVIFYRNKRSPTFNDEKFQALCMKYRLKTFLTETFQRPFKKLSDG